MNMQWDEDAGEYEVWGVWGPGEYEVLWWQSMKWWAPTVFKDYKVMKNSDLTLKFYFRNARLR